MTTDEQISSLPSFVNAITDFDQNIPLTNTAEFSISNVIAPRVDRTGSFIINKDGFVEVNGSISFRGYDGDKLPASFLSISDTLNCELATFTSLENMPESVGALNLSHCAKLENLNFPRLITISETLDISKTPITSLHNIHKNIKFVKSIVAHDCNFTDSLAGLLLIEGLQKFQSNMVAFDNIINKFLSSTRDPHVCAEELGLAGFEHLLEL